MKLLDRGSPAYYRSEQVREAFMHNVRIWLLGALGGVICVPLLFTALPSAENGYDLHMLGGFGWTLITGSVLAMMVRPSAVQVLAFASATTVLTAHEFGQVHSAVHTFEWADVGFQEIGVLIALWFL
jgi:hypothetical protein